MNDEMERNIKLANELAAKTCQKIVKIIYEDTKELSDEFVENYSIYYYETVVTSIVCTVVINLVKSLCNENEDSRNSFFTKLMQNLHNNVCAIYIKKTKFH